MRRVLLGRTGGGSVTALDECLAARKATLTKYLDLCQELWDPEAGDCECPAVRTLKNAILGDYCDLCNAERTETGPVEEVSRP